MKKSRAGTKRISRHFFGFWFEIWAIFGSSFGLCD
ncbi:hypothetical protein [Porphyromonas gulae]|nr:hypothetical protein [Porphyromonas gulae]